MTTDDKNTLPTNIARLRPEAPRKPAGEDPMLFWAERDPAIQWRSTAMMLVLMSPLVIFAPAQFISAALAVVATGWFNARGFHLRLSASELRVRPAMLAPTMRVPLAEIAEATTMPDAAGALMPMAEGSGHLLIRKTDGGQIVIPGIKKVAETVDAIRRLKAPPATDAGEDRAAA